MSLVKVKKADLWDQPAHFLVAFLTVFISAKLGGPVGGFAGGFLGFMLGMIREVTEEKKVRLSAVIAVVKSPGSRLDLFSWTMGGMTAGLTA